MKKSELKDEIVTLKDVTVKMSADEQKILYVNEDVVIIDTLNQLPTISNVMVDFFITIICYSGQIKLDANGNTYTITEGCSFSSSCYSLINNVWTSLDFKGKACCISHSFVNRVLLDNKEQWARLQYLVSHPLMTIKQEYKEMLDSLFQTIKNLCVFSFQPYYHASIEAIIRCGLFFMLGIVPETEIETEGILTGNDLFSRFIRLVKIDQGCHRNIEYYASKLYVTGKYLSSVCTKKSGKTAKQIITNQAIDRLRYLLLETDTPTKQIAADMLFPNLSFFGRYVIKHIGAPPSVLRK